MGQLFLPPDRSGLNGFVHELRKSFTINIGRSIRTRRIYYDTFDWRLYHSDITVWHQNGQWILADGKRDLQIGCMAAPGIRFADGFPPGRLREILVPMIPPRTLMARLRMDLLIRECRILDDNKKTTVAVDIYRIPEKGRHGQWCLDIRPMKGYEPEFVRLKDFCEARQLTPSPVDVFALFCQIKGVEPGDYSSKTVVVLSPEMSIGEASRLIMKQLLDTARINEQGVIDDVDSEFLHDYRVSIRRFRSLVGELKKIIRPVRMNRLKKDFRMIGSTTNVLRDLDVYLMRRDIYDQMLPENMRAKLGPFFDHLEEMRVSEQKKVGRYLQSRRYYNIMNYWMDQIDRPEAGLFDPENSRKALEFACRAIVRRYRKMVKSGDSVSEEIPDEKWHRIRIDGKKLRYLLEFFSSLFPAETVEQMTRKMKQLQDNLGDFNDLSVQQAKLRSYVLTESPAGMDNQEELMAIGVLIGKLHEHQQISRATLQAKMEEFSGGEMRKLFDRLMGSTPEVLT